MASHTSKAFLSLGRVNVPGLGLQTAVCRVKYATRLFITFPDRNKGKCLGRRSEATSQSESQLQAKLTAGNARASEGSLWPLTAWCFSNLGATLNVTNYLHRLKLFGTGNWGLGQASWWRCWSCSLCHSAHYHLPASIRSKFLQKLSTKFKGNLGLSIVWHVSLK